VDGSELQNAIQSAAAEEGEQILLGRNLIQSEENC
jgi:hypothetical protein